MEITGEVVPLNFERSRTLQIVKLLAKGKRLSLPDGTQIGMGEDMSIGFVLTGSDGVETIGGLSTMDLSQLNTILNQEEISFPIH